MTDLKTLSETNEAGFLRPEKLAMVHITNYMPEQSGDHFEIKSTAEATDYLYPRNTIHFTVGHHVSSHMSGNWDDKGIMIVASMKGIIDKNEKPLGMGSVDTYFETIPGHNLVLPKETQIFIPAPKDKELKGKLSLTEGPITYYKNTNFTEAEKKKIFDKARFPDGIYEISIYNGNQKISPEEIGTLPDDFFAFHLKKNMLAEFIQEKGYISNEPYHFHVEGSMGAKEVESMGKHLGCRFCTSGIQGHHWSDFNTTLIDDIYNAQYWSQFIFDSDSYSISKRKFLSPHIKKYSFVKKEIRDCREIGEASDRELQETIDFLRSGYDFSQDLAPENQEDKEMNSWTPAYRATYEIWRKKTLPRLAALYEKSKTFDFEAWQKKLDQRLVAYDQEHPKKLLSDAPVPWDNEKEKKASKLLSLLRERDKAGAQMTVRAFQKKKESQK